MLLRIVRNVLFVLIPLSMLGACAMTPAVPEEAVALRAQARLDALLAKRYKEVHSYFTPTYREALDFESWIRSHPPRATFLSAKVLTVRCISEDACDVEVESSYERPRGVKAPPKGVIERATAERWVRSEGQWWYYTKR